MWLFKIKLHYKISYIFSYGPNTLSYIGNLYILNCEFNYVKWIHYPFATV